MMFGALIDSTCRLWQTNSSECDESHGSCLLFDTTQLRWRTYGVVLGFQFVQLMFTFLLYFTIRRRRFHHGDVMSIRSLPPPTDGDENTPPTVDERNLGMTEVTPVQTQ